MTEWKIARSEKDATSAFAQARRQASLYGSGALAGIELAQYRYAVVVTRNSVQPPADVVEGSNFYRHINLAVEPKLPSKAAKKTS